VFSNTNFPIKEISQKDIITTDTIFSTINSIVAPQTQDAQLLSLINFQLVDEDGASTSIPPRLSYTKIEIRMVNPITLPRSLSLFIAIIKSFNNPSSSNNTYKVKLEYTNGQN